MPASVPKNPYKEIFNKSSSLCKTDTVRYVVLHPKLVKGSFSRLVQFTSSFGQPSLTLLLGYCTNWGIAITTVTFRRYGRVPLKTGAPIIVCSISDLYTGSIYHLTLFILDTVCQTVQTLKFALFAKIKNIQSSWFYPKYRI